MRTIDNVENAHGIKPPVIELFDKSVDKLIAYDTRRLRWKHII